MLPPGYIFGSKASDVDGIDRRRCEDGGHLPGEHREKAEPPPALGVGALGAQERTTYSCGIVAVPLGEAARVRSCWVGAGERTRTFDHRTTQPLVVRCAS